MDMPGTDTPTPSKPRRPLRRPAHLPQGWLLTLRRPLILLAHILAFALSLMVSFLVADQMQFERGWLVDQYPTLLLVFLAVKLAVFGGFGQYRGWWRYVGITDLWDIFRASLVSTLVLMGLWYTAVNIGEFRGVLPEALLHVSQGVFVADLFGTILILAGLRMVIRLYHEEFSTVEAVRLKRFLIVGAGDAGEALVRDIQRMAVVEYDVVCFIDDNPAKLGTQIHGVPVLGTVEQLPGICKEQEIEEIAIAIPSATHRQLRRVIQACQGAKVRFRKVPSLRDIASGRYRVSQIRRGHQ
jgi:FlaA1/EpsC-like NDP-sugar epimerase